MTCAFPAIATNTFLYFVTCFLVPFKVGGVLSQSIRKTLRSDPSQGFESGITVSKLLRVHCDGDLRKEIKSRCFFYRNSSLVRSGIITIDTPYTMPYSDLGDSCCELDHMVLDYVAGLHTELNEIMDSARCYRPNVKMDSVILPKPMKDLVLQSAENFEVFRRLRKEVSTSRTFFQSISVIFCQWFFFPTFVRLASLIAGSKTMN